MMGTMSSQPVRAGGVARHDGRAALGRLPSPPCARTLHTSASEVRSLGEGLSPEGSQEGVAKHHR